MIPLPSLNFGAVLTAGGMAKLGQIIVGDLTMAGDNVVIMGTLTSGLPERERRRVIMLGVGMALVFLIGFALIATQLLHFTGLVLAGGLLLLWVAWKMWRELRHTNESPGCEEIEGDEHSGVGPAKSFAGAAWGVAIADVSMSLDNVLAVAGAAREHPGILIVGLIFAVILMGIAANVIAKYIERYRWIAYAGLVVILWVALKMVWDGYHDVAPVLGWPTVSGVA